MFLCEGDRYERSSFGLLILSPAAQDQGLYECEAAVNEMGRIDSHFISVSIFGWLASSKLSVK